MAHEQDSLFDLNRELVILNLRIDNMELRYRQLQEAREEIKTKISQLESVARKPAPKEKESK